MGIIHADQPARDSLVFDVMEPIRPEADQYLLDLLQGHTLRAGDFHETRRGTCRVLPPLTHALGTTALIWAEHAAPVVERVARMLADTDFRISRIPTPLTQTNRRKAEPLTVSAGMPQPNCNDCGQPHRGRGDYCPECRVSLAVEQMPVLQAQAAAVLAQARAADRDPAHGGDAATKRGATNARQLRKSFECDRNNQRPDPQVFKTEILRQLQGVPLRVMAEATGLSEPYCSLIRRGHRTPHPRHWDLLGTLGSAKTPNRAP